MEKERNKVWIKCDYCVYTTHIEEQLKLKYKVKFVFISSVTNVQDFVKIKLN